MLVDLTSVFKGVTGKVIKEAGSDLELTMNAVCVNSLLTERPPVQNELVSTEEKTKRYVLAMKIIAAKDEIELTATEVVLIQSLLNIYPAITCGQAKILLDG